MTTLPSDPRRLVILNRVVEVLAAIRTGADYFFTPFEVFNKLIDFNDCRGFPTYAAHIVNGGGLESREFQLFEETFMISIKGYVQDQLDPEAKREKSIRQN